MAMTISSGLSPHCDLFTPTQGLCPTSPPHCLSSLLQRDLQVPDRWNFSHGDLGCYLLLPHHSVLMLLHQVAVATCYGRSPEASPVSTLMHPGPTPLRDVGLWGSQSLTLNFCLFFIFLWFLIATGVWGPSLPAQCPHTAPRSSFTAFLSMAPFSFELSEASI